MESPRRPLPLCGLWDPRVGPGAWGVAEEKGDQLLGPQEAPGGPAEPVLPLRERAAPLWASASPSEEWGGGRRALGAASGSSRPQRS